MGKIKVRLTVNVCGDMTLTPVSKRVSRRLAKYNDNGYSVIFSQEADENAWKGLPKSAFYHGKFNHNAKFLVSDEMMDCWANSTDDRLERKSHR